MGSKKSPFLVFAGLALLYSGIDLQAGESDALAISANIQARHLPYGAILDPVFAAEDSTQIVGYTRCGDSAIWTGHYLAAESFRYKVTHSAQALDNVREAVSAIKGLVDVTGTNLLARCMVPIDSPYAEGIKAEEASNGIFTNQAAGWIWVGNTSRDEYSGAMFGLGVAYDMVDDAALKTSITDLVTRLVDFLRGHTWTVVMPNGDISTVFLVRPDQMLTFVSLGRHVNPDHFSTLYDEQRVLLSATMLAPLGVDVASDDSYFKFNLNYINLYNLVRLESSSFKSIYEKGYDITRSHTAGHQNAFFNVIDLALNGPNGNRDTETLYLLEGWLLRQRVDKFVDLHDTVAVCGDQACDPVPIAIRPPTDFIWQRSPFQLSGGLYGTIEGAGIDYILPYWMARYYGLSPAFRVQSSAAAITAVAPGSMASLYGSALSATTEEAMDQALPLTLGGTSLKVKDALGIDRDAPLIYVSSGLINFVVPADTAPGVATITITRSGAAPLMAPVRVRNVAPALFTLNGEGTGVAAAIAYRTIAGNPTLQTPVPVYQCDDSGCFATPIDMGVDTPVFVTFTATGIRNRSSLDNVKVTINGMSVPVRYAGPQPGGLAGLDQLTVGLVMDLRGSGDSNVVLTVDGQVSNTITINIL